MNTGNVLIVEDDASWRHTLARAHVKAGYTVSEAENGRAALSLLNTPPLAGKDYDVVLTDIVMDDVDGIEVTHIARRLQHPPEVILLTGYGSLETAMEAVRAGAFEYLLKPCHIAHLLKRVSAAVERRRQCVERNQKLETFDEISHIITGMQQTRSSVSGQLSGYLNMAFAETDPRYRQVGDIRIDTYSHKVWFCERLQSVTPTEYKIITCLSETPGRVFTYGDIIQATHGENLNGSDAHELLRQHIRSLRRKFARNYFINVYGVGYMLVDPNENIMVTEPQ
jgi:DNA-binding response OmpR family regulator